MRYRKGEISRKILLLLLGGVSLGLTHSPKQYFKILGEMADVWKGVNKFNFKRTIKNLYHSRILKEVKNKDGTISVVLSEKGKKIAEVYSLDNLKINKSKKWDGNWRLVIFDVPERIKKVRDALRMHLKNLGFYELQKSVFICPFPCTEEINQIVDFYNIHEHIRVIIAHSIDNEEELMKQFNVS